MNKGISFIKKHPYRFIMGLITFLASLATILNWVNLTSNQVLIFFKLRIISLTIPEFIIVVIISAYISYRIFAKKYPIVSYNFSSDIKERAIKLNNYPKKLDDLIQQWKILRSSICGD
ncbi:MAG: hypothetical protein ACFFDN_18770 [Candidatus Hodarchaeota archaeon]